MAKTVGQYLKEIRLQRGLSLEQAAQATHVNVRYLEAIEKDMHSALPSAVQGRGFMRLYAGFLELPAEPLAAAWDGKQALDEAALQPKAASEPKPALESEDAPGLNEPGEAEAASGPAEDQDKLPASAGAFAGLKDAPGPVPIEFQSVEPLPVEPPKPGAAATVGRADRAGTEDRNSENLSSRDIFAEIGQQLKKQREILGLSLVEVERYTRLRVHYLSAIEEGRIDLLPSPVQGKGMLGNYAAFLNLDGDALLLRFAEGLQKRRIERLPPPEPQAVAGKVPGKRRPARPASALRRFVTPDLIFGIIVVAAILFFAVRTALAISSQPQVAVKPTTRAIADILLTPEQTEQPGKTLTPSGAQTARTLVSGAEAPSSTLVTPPSGVLETATLASVSTIEPINNDPLQIYIIAQQRAFLRIVVDNKEKFSGRVVPGNAYAFSGLKTIGLQTGNAAALQVYFNQNDLGNLGASGQVLNLVFSAQGIVTATPLPTPTITLTPLVTATPLTTGTPTTAPTPTSTVQP